MRCEFANANFGGELLHDMPDQLFRHAFAPYFTAAAYPPEKAASVNPGGIRPVVQQLVNPIRNRNRSNVPSLSPQVYYCPMPVPLLEMRQSQFRQFVATKPTGQQHRKKCPITFSLDLFVGGCLPKRLSLFGGQPVAQPDAQLLYALDGLLVYDFQRGPRGATEASRPHVTADSRMAITETLAECEWTCRSPRLKVNRLLYTPWDNSLARGQFSRVFTWLVCHLR